MKPQKNRILVTDDDEVVLNGFKRTLGRGGYKVDTEDHEARRSARRQHKT